MIIRMLFVLILLAGCAHRAPAPEARQTHYMVAAADPRATAAGLDILRAGGSAVDAAIATQMVLTLVEPQSSGIGGGAFLLSWDQAKNSLKTYDGRETAPASARPGMFLKNGAPMGYWQAAKSGRAVGVPGVIAMLWQAHEAHGVMRWPRLFERAIELAETGFTVSPRLAEELAATPGLSAVKETKAQYFTPDGKPVPAGTLIKNRALAKAFRIIADKGPDGFYKGTVARDIAAAVAHAPKYPATMTAADLQGYKPKQRAPLCGTYRGYKICSMGPPSSGGVTVIAMLKMLEPFDIGRLEPGSVEAVHLIAEASRLAYADRDRYLGDSDAVAVPLKGLLDDGYLRARSGLIRADSAMAKAEPGNPPAATPAPAASAHEGPSTSHMSIVDAQGNAVSMTTTVEGPFGSNLMADGFILNNQLTDFSFLPEQNGVRVPNAVAPGKRPLSSMAPSIVFAPDGSLFAVIGSPGGKRIIAYVAEALIGLIDWKLDMKKAVALPHFVAAGDTLELEAGTPLVERSDALTKLGHHISVSTSLTSGLEGIRFAPGKLDGASDPRREGVAAGD